MTYTVRVNNFVKNTDISTVDPLSKVFIAIQWVLGLNRMGVLCKTRLANGITTLCAVIFLSLVTSSVFWCGEYVSAELVKLLQFITCGVLCLASRNRYQRYYDELNKFDAEIGCKPKITRESILILISMVALCICTVVPCTKPGNLQYIPLHIIQIIETHYYGLLFIVLNQRLRLINYCIESSLISTPNSALVSKMNEFSFFKHDGKKMDLSMNKLMDFYYIIINAYDLLTDAIKWQLLFIISTSFVYTLMISYNLAVGMLGPNFEPLINSITDMVLIASEAIPLMAPCMSCDMLRYEVRKLRELLASKLFESKLDKSNRSVARALLALTNARNLSFSLMRMVDISISLPFSFLGLLATYLIILLQFQKVIYPSERSFSSLTTIPTTIQG